MQIHERVRLPGAGEGRECHCRTEDITTDEVEDVHETRGTITNVPPSIRDVSERALVCPSEYGEAKVGSRAIKLMMSVGVDDIREEDPRRRYQGRCCTV